MPFMSGIDFVYIDARKSFSVPDTFFFLISPSSPKQLGMVSPELLNS